MQKIEIPDYLSSHFFWIWYWKQNYALLDRMNKSKNRSSVEWSYPSSSVEFYRAFDKCPVCGGKGKKFFPETKIEQDGKSFTLSSAHCVCEMVSFFDQPANRFESTDLTPFDFSQFKFNVEPHAKGEISFQKLIVAMEKWTDFPFRWLYLWGPVGSGKTSILSAMKTKLGNLMTYITAQDLSNHAFAALGGAEYTPVDLINELAAAPILVIDDLGAQYQKGDWVPSIVANIVNKRYARKAEAPIVISSNVSDTEFRETTDQYLKRAADRILDHDISRTAFCNAVSYRTGR